MGSSLPLKESLNSKNQGHSRVKRISMPVEELALEPERLNYTSLAKHSLPCVIFLRD